MKTLIATLALGLLWSGVVHAEWFRRAEDLMGTRVSVEAWHTDAAVGEAAVDAVMAEYHRINELMSTYRSDSEISAVNARAAEQPVEVSGELVELVARALALSRLSGGAFDITFDSVGRHYDFREGRVPDAAEIEAGLTTLGWQLVAVDTAARTIRFERPGVRINLGGIAKGYAVERGAAILADHGVEHAALSAGGDTRLVGDRRGQPWVVGIRDPRADEDVVTRLPLVDEAISTSGDYERFFERDGMRYHHILNPVTGRPASGARSATVIGPDATLTDGLSTTVFVLGVERGLELIERTSGYETVVVDAEGRMHYSSGLVGAD